MPQSARSFSADITVFTLAATSYLATLKDAKVSREFEEKESRAVKDTSQYLVAGIEKFTMTASVCVEGAAVMLALAGTRIAFTLKETGSGLTYSGTGLVSTGEHDFGADAAAQMESITIKGGALTHA